jgi:catechol 2,3-dioxygenase-like lactoylglutathione lyase family enzyme
MAVKVLELHHHGIRVGPSHSELEQSLAFYANVLGLSPDAGRPEIPTIGGYWMNVGDKGQIHLMGVDGMSKFAEGPDRDPSRPHVALAVPDIQEAKRELDRLGVDYWFTRGVVGPQSEQLFMRDPAGNMIELHQIGTCRCTETGRAVTAGAMS